MDTNNTEVAGLSWLSNGYFSDSLDEADPELAEAVRGELDRQQDQIELIASENLVSRAVLQAQGSVLTNKTVEGYPGGRYYGGADFADRIEQLAVDRAKALFGCKYANVQPHSGSNANQAVFLALLGYGDSILSMDVASGLRLSVNAGTTRGFGVDEFSKIGCWIAEVLQGLVSNPTGNTASEQCVRNEVHRLCQSFPIYR